MTPREGTRQRLTVRSCGERVGGGCLASRAALRVPPSACVLRHSARAGSARRLQCAGNGFRLGRRCPSNLHSCGVGLVVPSN